MRHGQAIALARCKPSVNRHTDNIREPVLIPFSNQAQTGPNAKDDLSNLLPVLSKTRHWGIVANPCRRRLLSNGQNSKIKDWRWNPGTGKSECRITANLAL
jgi:hypothetical protein